MLINLSIQLTEPVLPKDNRPSFVSFIKNAFMAYDKSFYDKYYSEATTSNGKNFCFAIKMSQPVFCEDKIQLQNNLIFLTISTSDAVVGIDIYNALCYQRDKLFPLPAGNSMVLKTVRLMNHKPVMSSSITIQMRSPLIVRTLDRSDRRYLSYDDEKFQECFQKSITSYVQKMGMNIDSKVTITPVSPKKTVMKNFGHYMTGNLGTYTLTGHPLLLNLLYQSGIGARRSEGFGLFGII